VEMTSWTSWRTTVPLLLMVVATRVQAGAPSLTEALRARLQPLLDERAARLNSGFTLAFKNADTALSLTAGTVRRTSDRTRYPVSNMRPSDELFYGSVTKMYTAASIMRLVDQGLVGLDDPAHIHVDPVLRLANASSMLMLFGPSAAKVTVRYLLSMRSGLYDFDDDETRRFCNSHPDTDVSPIDDLWFASTRGRKQPLYPAGHSQDYSSTNYELLGLILLQHANLTSWALLDQRQAAFRADIAPRFPKTRFALRGLCETYTRVHGYEPDDKYGLNLDTAFLSCTNGYTCGNVVTTAGEVADFVWALYGEASIVSRRSVDAMSDIWEWYGLGTMDLPSYGRAGDAYCRLGHFGVTYGYTANAAYSPSLGYALVWGTNQEDPGQTATHGASYDFLMQFDCELMSAVMSVLSNGTHAPLNCAWLAVNSSQSGACGTTRRLSSEGTAARRSGVTRDKLTSLSRVRERRQ